MRDQVLSVWQDCQKWVCDGSEKRPGCGHVDKLPCGVSLLPSAVSVQNGDYCRSAFHCCMSAVVDKSSHRSCSQILSIHHGRRSAETRRPQEEKKEEKKTLIIALTSCGKHVGMATLPARLSLWSPPNTRHMSAVWQTEQGKGRRASERCEDRWHHPTLRLCLMLNRCEVVKIYSKIDSYPMKT